jgi:hypothetical protein
MRNLLMGFVFTSVCLAPPEPCQLGDLNFDGRVSGADVSVVLVSWGTDDPIADIDGSGLVDGADLNLVLIDWDNCSKISK